MVVWRWIRWLHAEHGMALVLALLCAALTVATWGEQHPGDAAAARELAARILRESGPSARVLIAVQANERHAAFADELAARLRAGGAVVAAEARGTPADARAALERLARQRGRLDAVACLFETRSWGVFERLPSDFPGLGRPRVLSPASHQGSNFLKPSNLLNIANQIAVIAVIAIGMTLVIITGGIDLSVGSLVALAAVVTAVLIRDLAGGKQATAAGVVGCGAAAVALCALAGAFSGSMVTVFRVPPFIVTLALMLVARGLAYIVAREQSIDAVPDNFTWLGRGADLFGLPNAVALMLLLYLAAHVLMTRSTLGRYVYAVGGNPEAARLSGVPCGLVVLLVYTLGGALAGLGGVVLASQLKSGAPTLGVMYELSVIAAVVVGGASLAGGEGKILGTLVGVFIIAVIQNGMNLLGLGSHTQNVVLGLVILGAVWLDQLKRGTRG